MEGGAAGLPSLHRVSAAWLLGRASLLPTAEGLGISAALETSCASHVLPGHRDGLVGIG